MTVPTNLLDFLSNRIDMNDVEAICVYTQGKENDARKEELYRVMMDDEGRAGGNAAWIFSHSLWRKMNGFLASNRN